MILENLKLGTLETNCFLIGCKDTKEAAVIDPGGEVELILEKAAKHNLKIKYIINTHGHIDHIEGNKALHEATGADILIHKEDSGMLTNPLINGSILFFGKTVISPTASRFIDEGDIIKVGNLNLEVLYTPGHTKGGISIKLKNRVYVGDTLFYLSIGRTDLPGVIVQPPAFLLPPDVGDGPVAMQYLLVDVGLQPKDVGENVRIGDPVSFAQVPLELSGDTLAGHTLDNRVSVTAVTICLEMLQRRLHDWDVWAVASTQEEETLGGALTSPFEIQPDLAIVIDVCFAKGTGGSDWRVLTLGEGIGLGWGPNIHPALYKAMEEKAIELEIPYSRDLMPRMSGTDATAVQVVREGIPTAVLGIPLRYMHTPVEMVSIKDIKRVGRLMAEFISDLKPDFIESIKWED